MISHLKGKLIAKNLTDVVVEVGGVGFSVHLSLQSSEQLPDVGSDVHLLTYLHVREDALTLYGFITEAERQMFIYLTSVSGIGPKMAIGILSGRNADEIKNLVVHENISALTSLPGVGKKTAERIVVELKDKLAKIPLRDGVGIKAGVGDIRSEALMALISLGYSRQAAEGAIKQSILSSIIELENVEELIREALKRASQ